jgi:alcohol dehydrogenase (cytochrome c)
MRSVPAIMAFAALAALAACAGGNGKATIDASPSPHSSVAAVGDADRGRVVFAANCSVCHGVNGVEGGVGPSLRGEHNRKNYDATIAWIKHPQPPMPKLYPVPLSERDVDDVAAFVQKL